MEVATTKRGTSFVEGVPVSPELALVDPALRMRLRDRLASGGDTLSSLRPLTRTTRASDVPVSPSPTSVPVPVAVPDWDAAMRSLVVRARAANRQHPRYLQSAVAAVVILIVLLVDVHVQLGRPSEAGERLEGAPVTVPAPVEPPAVEPVTTASPKPASPVKPAPVKPGRSVPTAPRPTADAVRRFAWAPVAGASAYRFELFRGSARVFTAETARPQLAIPPSWINGATRQSLRPGEYRWYVWPVTAGVRASQAAVQSTLVVPAP